MSRQPPPAPRAEVETISLRLPKHLAMAIRKYCDEHAGSGNGVLGAQAPTISSVIRALIEERFGEAARKSGSHAVK